jgi:hypothetical protein
MPWEGLKQESRGIWLVFESMWAALWRANYRIPEQHQRWVNRLSLTQVKKDGRWNRGMGVVLRVVRISTEFESRADRT